MNTAELAREEPAANDPSETDLLDVLYEVLAQGVPAKGSLRAEDVERFLHEHARSKKSVPEMLEFFRHHNLPNHASLYGADPELGELASGLHRDRAPLAAYVPDEPSPELRSASESGPVLKLASLVEASDTAPRARLIEVAVPAPARQRFSPGLLAFAGTIVVMAGALLATFQYAQGLRSELSQARLQQRTTDAALSTLENRAESLRDALSRSEGERQTLADRFDAFILGEGQKRNAEEVALERLLGPRFEILRDKALQDAYLSSP